MTSLIQIARSWYDYIRGTAYTKHLMEKRLAICDGCEYKVATTGTAQILVGALANSDPHAMFSCGACGCPLVGLTAGASNKCSMDKWKPAGDESYF